LLVGLDRLRREDDLALLLVEQHARLALELAQLAIVLDRGAVVFSGPSHDLFANPERLGALISVGGRDAGA
jgi:branched-chain amino acid transport system ATP-binding protein